MKFAPRRRQLPGRSSERVCPSDRASHQPAPTPWWSGSSLYERGAPAEQPTGPWAHVSIAHFAPGDLLTSPAARRELPAHVRLEDDGCLDRSAWDAHAVYVSNQGARNVGVPGAHPIDTLWCHHVLPQSRLWPDPETAGAPWDSGWWCTTSAVVVAAHRLDEHALDCPLLEAIPSATEAWTWAPTDAV